MNQNINDFINEVILQPDDVNFIKDNDIIRFFKSLDQGDKLSALATTSVLSLKHQCYFVLAGAAASAAIVQYLHNIEFDKSLKFKYYENGVNYNGVQMLGTGTGATALAPYHISAKFYKMILQGQTPIFNFACVRNPFTRFYRTAIKYYNPQNPQQTIDIVMPSLEKRDVHFQPLIEALHYNHIHFDYIIRFENYLTDMKALFPNYKDTLAVPIRTKQHYDQFYSHPELVSFVQETYKEDFENFGYSFDVKQHDHYDNNVIPRNLEKRHNSSSSFSFDLSYFTEPSIIDLGYYPNVPFSGTVLSFLLNSLIDPSILKKLVMQGYDLRKFKNIEQTLIDFANKLPDK